MNAAVGREYATNVGPPPLTTIVKQVEQAIRRPKIEAIKTGVKLAGKKGKAAAKGSITDGDTKRKLDTYREGLIPHFNKDIGDLAAVTAYSYDYLLSMRLVSAGSEIHLRKMKSELQKAENRPESFPLSFFIASEVDTAADELESQISRLKALRGVFASAIPASLAALGAVELVNLKGLASNFSSLRAGDIELVKEVLRTCDRSVKIIDKALAWAEKREDTIQEWQRAHADQQPASALP